MIRSARGFARWFKVLRRLETRTVNSSTLTSTVFDNDQYGNCALGGLLNGIVIMLTLKPYESCGNISSDTNRMDSDW